MSGGGDLILAPEHFRLEEAAAPAQGRLQPAFLAPRETGLANSVDLVLQVGQFGAVPLAFPVELPQAGQLQFLLPGSAHPPGDQAHGNRPQAVQPNRDYSSEISHCPSSSTWSPT